MNRLYCKTIEVLRCCCKLIKSSLLHLIQIYQKWQCWHQRILQQQKSYLQWGSTWWLLDRKSSWGFHKLDEIDTIGNFDIRGFITNIFSNKMSPHQDWTWDLSFQVWHSPYWAKLLSVHAPLHFLDLDGSPRINRALLYKHLSLRPTSKCQVNSERTWNHRSQVQSSLGVTFCWNFLFHIVKSLMPILPMLCFCENPNAYLPVLACCVLICLRLLDPHVVMLYCC